MLSRCKIPLFGFLFVFIAILTLNFASSSSSSSVEDQKVKQVWLRDLNNKFIKIEEKFDSNDKKFERLNSSAGNDAFHAALHEIVTNITRAISDSNDEMTKKMEQNRNKMEEKQNKMEEKLNDLFHLLNARDIHNKKRNASGAGVWGGVRALCHSTCQDKLTAWANQTGSQLTTSLEQINVCLNNQQTTTTPALTTTTPALTTTTPALTTTTRSPCHPNQCLHGGKCQRSSTGSGYECVCLKFTSGNRCQNVECAVEKRCWRLKDTLYIVIETQLTWAEAKVKCEKEGMTLAMPKNEEKSRFLRSQLKAIYTIWPYIYLWIGIKRDEGGDGFYWVDGSRLGQYTGGRAEMKFQTGSKFGELWLTGETHQTWSWGSATRHWYPLCEYPHLTL